MSIRVPELFRKARPTMWALIGMAAMFVILYLPIFKPFGYSDDYWFLYLSHQEGFLMGFVSQGRALQGLLFKAVLTQLPSIDMLWCTRLLGTAGVFCAAFILYRLLRKYVTGSLLAVAGLCFFLATPSANILGFWSATCEVGWSLALSLLGGQLVVGALESSSRARSWGLSSAGIALGIVSLFTYQPGFTAFIIPGLLHYLRHNHLKRTLLFLGGYLLTYALYFILHKSILYVGEFWVDPRTAITGHPFSKIRWFLEGPVKMMLYDNFLFYPAVIRRFVAVLTILLMGAGFWFMIRGRSLRGILVTGGVLTVFLFFTYIPNLASADPWISYRTLSSLFMFKIAIVTFSLDRLCRGRYRISLFAGVAMALALFVGNSWFNINRGIIDLQTREYSLIREKVKSLVPELRKTKKLVFVEARAEFVADEGVLPWGVTDEFGLLSTFKDWVPEPMVRQILKQEGRTALEHNLEVIKITPENRDEIVNYKELPMISSETLFREKGF